MPIRLANDREDYRAAEPTLLKFAKVQGWVGAEPESLWATFSKLSQADIDKVRRRLQEQIEQEKGRASTASELAVGAPVEAEGLN
ncbi:MAG: hypothetical protein WAK48_02950 [Candidatus Acidiferrum sp.]